MVGAVAFTLAIGAFLAAPALAGYKILFFVFCPRDGFTQQDTVKVKIPAKAPGYKAQLESPPGTALGPGQPVCPGTTVTQEITRTPDPQDQDKDVIKDVITTDNTGGGGSEQQVQALFEAKAHADLGVTKVAYDNDHSREIDTVREGRPFTWLIKIRNHGKLPIKAGELKLTDVLPKGFKYDGTNEVASAIKVRPPADGHGPTFTFRSYKDIEPNGGVVVSIFGEQKLPDDLEEQVIQNHVTVKDRDPSHTEPAPDPHPNDVYAPLTVRSRNN